MIADRDYHPDPQALLASLPSDHLQWHVWQRAEIENYLLHIPAITRLVASGTEQLTIDEVMLKQEFEKLMETSRIPANDRLVQAYDEVRKRTKESWDAATMARKAREYLAQHWEAGETRESIIRGYRVEEEDIRAALRYAADLARDPVLALPAGAE